MEKSTPIEHSGTSAQWQDGKTMVLSQLEKKEGHKTSNIRYDID